MRPCRVIQAAVTLCGCAVVELPSTASQSLSDQCSGGMAAGTTFVQGPATCHTNASGQHSMLFRLQRHAASIRSYSGLNPSRKAELRQEAATTCCRSALANAALYWRHEAGRSFCTQSDKRVDAGSQAEAPLAEPLSTQSQLTPHHWKTWKRVQEVLSGRSTNLAVPV